MFSHSQQHLPHVQVISLQTKLHLPIADHVDLPHYSGKGTASRHHHSTKDHKTHQHKARVDEGESARATYASTAVHNSWAMSSSQRPRLAHPEEKTQECGGRLGNAKVWPCSVVEMQDFLLFIQLLHRRFGSVRVHTKIETTQKWNATQLMAPKKCNAIIKKSTPLYSQDPVCARCKMPFAPRMPGSHGTPYP